MKQFRYRIRAWAMGFALALLIAAGAEPARAEEAAAERNGMCCLIPAGPSGEKDGDFWLYAEFTDEQGSPLDQEGLSAVMAVDSQELGVHEEGSLSAWNQGYLHTPVQIAPDSAGGFAAYTICVTLLDAEGNSLTALSASVPELIRPWPELVDDSWNGEWPSGKDVETVTRTFAFDWEDTGLFAKLFRVEVPEVPEHVTVAPQAEDSVWVMNLDRPCEETISILLTDAAGNSQTLAYHIAVSRDTGRIRLVLLLAASAAVLLAGLFVLRRRKCAGGQDALPGAGHTRGREPVHLHERRMELEEAHQNLEEAYQSWQSACQRLKESVRAQGSPDVGSVLQSEQMRERYAAGQATYAETKSRLLAWLEEGAGKAAELLAEPENREYYDNALRSLGDTARVFCRQRQNVTEEMERLLEERNRRNEKVRELMRPLGVCLKAEFSVGGKTYVVAREKSGSGFFLDEMRPLELATARQSSGSVKELLGESTHIRIASCGPGVLVLECGDGGCEEENGGACTAARLRKGEGLTLRRRIAGETIDFAVTAF